MKITLRELAKVAGRNPQNTAIPPLVKLVKDPVLRVRVRFHASIFFDQAQKFLTQHDTNLDEIKEKYGQLDESTNTWTYTEENERLAQIEAKELLDVEVDLVGDKLSIDDLEPHIGAEQDPKFILTGEDMLALRWLFKEYEDDPTETGQPKVKRSRKAKTPVGTKK